MNNCLLKLGAREGPAGVRSAGGRLTALTLLGLLLAIPGRSYPPAPHHLVYGTVRGELGHPLLDVNAEVLLEVDGHILARAPVARRPEPGVNYQLAIPVDSGVTPDLYKPTALRPVVPFRLRVQMGGVTYLPLEMSGAAALFSRPAERSRVDLTLGVDSDGDGLPDAWEQALIQMLGGHLTLADIRPGDDADNDGLSNLDEYLAGTYAFDPVDGFELAILSTPEGRPAVEFTAIRGRSYTVLASDDLQQWMPVTFTLPGDAAGGPARSDYYATDSRRLRLELNGPEPGRPAWRFFRLMVR